MKVSRQLEASPRCLLRWAKTFAIVNLSKDKEKQNNLIVKETKERKQNDKVKVE